MLLKCGAGEESLESLRLKEIQPLNPKGNQCWIFIGRTDAEAEAPILWPPDVKSWLTEKGPAAGKDWGQEEKGTTEDEMAGWHHGLDGCESEWTLGDGDGQGGLACCSSWGCKELDTTEQLNWTELRVHWTSGVSGHIVPTHLENAQPFPLQIFFYPTPLLLENKIILLITYLKAVSSIP